MGRSKLRPDVERLISAIKAYRKKWYLSNPLLTTQSVTICRESVVNHDECRHSIVNYRNPYHWLRENYEFKTTFGTNRIRGNESAIASMITCERRQLTLEGHSVAVGFHCGRRKTR